MTFEKKVAEFYRDFISIEDILRSIADEYECSLEEASLVLEQTLSHSACLGEPGLYEPGELRPHLVNRVYWSELRQVLKKKRFDAPVCAAYQKYLCLRDEINGILREAGFPINEAPQPRGDQMVEGLRNANNDGHTSEYEIRMADLERELAEVKAENERLSASSPLVFDGLMKIAIEVQHQYWSGYAKTGSGREKQEIIVSLIREKYSLSENQAKAVELVACPIPRNK